ncbi:hypothetical protein FEM48_Zijuj06G0046500 [Ziziphus jujuba var. spinosa]|uniref:Growth-regulating factor n=1 Tax=Ziziphus jujuba var. spinosa TaxID=714518 RepID=A0A978V777_ZIZJJ|nr:hypothetical protein FEM48_Zijuj06G0046500 [Ziziphus jujuba var. spinosa]
MDFGVVGLDGLGGSDTGGFASSLASDPETKQKWYGSGFHKQERSGASQNDWRSSKLAKTDDFSGSKAMLLQQKNALLRSNCTLFSDGQQQQQMLSFSSPKSESFLLEKTSPNVTLPYFHNTLSAYNRNTGYSSGSLNGGSVHGAITGARGLFTPSQWMELEHQALIYKYITANVPIPSNLLIPIRKALESAGFSGYSGGLLRPNTLGWGAFHLGFSNNADPEPGRCRRTDGKKWRCSRDAVADQKYCERHMNRGRHRSRKPVEGQTGHSAAGATTATTTSKLMPTVSSSSSSVALSGGAASNSLAIANQQLHSLQPQPPAAASNSSSAATAIHVNRMFVKENAGERMQSTPGLSLLSKENHFLSQKQQQNPFEESSREFGLITSDSFLNSSTKTSSSLISCRNFDSSSHELTDRVTDSQHSLRQFINEWPKNQSDHRSSVSWSDLDTQSDRTQLSISIPMASSDFTPSSSSPNNEKLVTLSPLRLSRGLESVPMGLGVGDEQSNNRQANWIPISWENSLGGPLGEVLNHTNNNNGGGECKNPSVLNLMTEGWDSSPPLGSSPTGVLQKTAFVSLSNSSAGSSPRAENNKTHEGASLCNDLLGSNLVASSSLPAL